MPTLLEALTKRNVAVNSQAVVGGSNTTTETYIEPGGWRMWDEFNYDTLTRIFRRKLASEYRGSSEPRALELDLVVNNEETLEDLLRRFVSPCVNYALEHQQGHPHLGRGSRCGFEDRPDWSAISTEYITEHGQFANILPGDTKLDAKWSPWMSEDMGSFNEWQKVLAQELTYMARYRTRYGFIITDANLVVLRITRELIGAGLAQTCPRREPAVSVGHQRHSSDVTMGSGDGSSSFYSDDSPLEWSYHDPEYAVIPWNAHGKEVLTIKLALWSLIMMATSGNRGIDYSYPPLDSWRYNGEGYVHNTSGATKAELSQGDHLLVEPNVMSWEGGQDVDDIPQSTHDGGTSSADPSHACQRDEVEAYVGGSSRQAAQGPEDDDQKTEVGSSHRHHKRKKVRIEKHLVTRKLYYLNANGDKVDTSRAQWTRVDGGYELKGRKNVYFTEQFPH
ncbi:hypothetical protein H9Q74_009187 [Fusarium xylarioides]|nr:hypothetical protein H9Q71_013722 [Fusarium xylarioides]KAG5819935.1 hypothetical protein H9Q74_009187 [Fusarium xylarioides]